MLLQFSMYERRALRWGPLLQLPLVDAFFAAHALGCLTAVVAGGKDLSLEVRLAELHLGITGSDVGNAVEHDLFTAL
jgi:hypothetical protein